MRRIPVLLALTLLSSMLLAITAAPAQAASTTPVRDKIKSALAKEKAALKKHKAGKARSSVKDLNAALDMVADVAVWSGVGANPATQVAVGNELGGVSDADLDKVMDDLQAAIKADKAALRANRKHKAKIWKRGLRKGIKAKKLALKLLTSHAATAPPACTLNQSHIGTDLMFMGSGCNITGDRVRILLPVKVTNVANFNYNNAGASSTCQAIEFLMNCGPFATDMIAEQNFNGAVEPWPGDGKDWFLQITDPAGNEHWQGFTAPPGP